MAIWVVRVEDSAESVADREDVGVDIVVVAESIVVDCVDV